MDTCNQSPGNRGIGRTGLQFASLLLVFLGPCIALRGQEIIIRAPQVGYWINETKVGIAFSKSVLPGDFALVSERNEGNVFFTGKTKPITNAAWGQFPHHAELDFSTLYTPGKYILKIGSARSLPVQIGDRPYGKLSADLLEFMRQQRCGYNLWLGTNCHQFDGRTVFGPQTNGMILDARGGWHDAGDLLKYLLTSGNATAQIVAGVRTWNKAVLLRKTSSHGLSRARD